jgi:Tol biopolymer transport system component
LWDVQADTVSLFAPDVLDAAWSPCGRHVALLVPGEPVVQDGQYAGTHPAAGDARVYSVVVLDVEAGQVQFSAQGPEVALDVWEFFHGRLRPRWSPDGSDRGGGSLLQFFDAGGDLAYYQPATGKNRTLTKGAGSTLLNADAVHLSSSPDGQYLALMYDGRDETARIDVVDLGR